MNAEHLLAHFDRIADAPDAIPRLRRFILELAVRGKIIGKYTEWETTVLGAVGEWGSGGTPSKSHPEYYGGNIPWLVIGDLNDSLVTSAATCITEEGLNKSSAKLVYPGTVLIAMYGSIGKLGVAGIRCATNQAIAYCVPDESRVIKEYLVILLKSIRGELTKKGHGVAQQNISQKILKAQPIDLPSVAEQHRIVAKVDELMALCDKLEAAQKEREAQRDRLVAASLQRLNQPAEGEAFREHVRFHLDHLPQMLTRPEQINEFRQTIRNLAVRGKLVPRIVGDESVHHLIDRINLERQASKSRLASGRRIPRADNESCFDYPSHWVTVSLADILIELQTGPFGSALHQSDYQRGGIPVINPASIRNQTIVPIDDMAVGAGVAERLAAFRLRTGDIVMGRRGEMGRCAAVTEAENGWICGSGSLILRLPKSMFSRFLTLLIGSPMVREYLGGASVGSTMQNLNQSILLRLCFGLPPLAEQHRIVAKVDELMAVCDELEAALTTVQTERKRLLEAVLHDALVSGSHEAPQLAGSGVA